MTVGELALLYNTERKIGASVEVVECRGWSRDDLYDRTGLVWINPSPNMRSLTEALLYPGVGPAGSDQPGDRPGTDTPFERVGAPWIEPVSLRRRAQRRGRSRAFGSSRSTSLPANASMPDRRCGGVQIVVTSWSDFDPLRLG